MIIQLSGINMLSFYIGIPIGKGGLMILPLLKSLPIGEALKWQHQKKLL